MSMGRKADEQQGALLLRNDRIDAATGHATSDRLTALLSEHGFDGHVEVLSYPF